ncbi:hypothetical protein SRHO_G00253410 [Serrasalmus rhombeus]
MELTKKERIEVILMSGERSCHKIAADFNNRHLERPPISHCTFAPLIAKFQEIRTVDNKETSTMVLAAFAKSPQLRTRRLTAECSVSQSSLVQILHTNKSHPFKIQLQQKLSEDDPDRRVEFCTCVRPTSTGSFCSVTRPIFMSVLINLPITESPATYNTGALLRRPCVKLTPEQLDCQRASRAQRNCRGS